MPDLTLAREYLSGFESEAMTDEERANRRLYLEEHLRRFVTTLDLVPDGTGRLLEIGAAPYFETLLLRRFRRYEIALTNGVGNAERENEVRLLSGEREERFTFERFNIESDPLPYPPESFDVVLCCEVIEHMTNDPFRGLAALNQALRPGGVFILTTPNAARFSNALAGLSGEPIYYGYSALGPYGRHNREYTPTEMRRLLEHAGFRVDREFTADMSSPRQTVATRILRPLIAAWRRATTLRGATPRPEELGEFMFFRATKVGAPQPDRPEWLYTRSYATEEG
jgi:SAM-dependent methyltransferase